MLFLWIMFAENFFLTLSLWREQPKTAPRHSLWHEDAQGIRRQFVMARVAGARVVRPEGHRPHPAKRRRVPTIPMARVA